MKFSVLTLFPLMFPAFTGHGIVRKGVELGLIEVDALNIRDFARDKHHCTDDRPYGGGSGMVLKPEPLADAIRAAKKAHPGARVALLGPSGEVFSQKTAERLAGEESLILVCGRYEGVDERICATLIDEEISMGDFILSGGEPAAMTVIDAVARLVPGVLGNEDSAVEESFSDGLLEHGHYTRPPEFEGLEIPEVLKSGNHKVIENWRAKTALLYTLAKRPDLLEERSFSSREIKFLREWGEQIADIIRAQALHSPDAPPGDQ